MRLALRYAVIFVNALAALLTLIPMVWAQTFVVGGAIFGAAFAYNWYVAYFLPSNKQLIVAVLINFLVFAGFLSLAVLYKGRIDAIELPFFILFFVNTVFFFARRKSVVRSGAARSAYRRGKRLNIQRQFTARCRNVYEPSAVMSVIKPRTVIRRIANRGDSGFRLQFCFNEGSSN